MPRGRPTKLTPKVREAICDAISIGAHHKLAAGYARVSEAALINWLNWGREERKRIEEGGSPDPAKRRYVELLSQVEDAEASAGTTWLNVVDKAAQTDANWAWRLLKQRFPEGFQDVDRREISGPNGAPVRLEIVEELVDVRSGEDTTLPSTENIP